MGNILHKYVCGVIPPHILTRVAEHTSNEASGTARATLEHMRELATGRAATLLQRPTAVPATASQRGNAATSTPLTTLSVCPANSFSASTRLAVRMSRSTRPTTAAVRRTIFSPMSFGDPPSMAGECVSTPPCTTASPSRTRSGTAVRWFTATPMDVSSRASPRPSM